MLQFFGENEEDAVANAEKIFQYEHKLAVPRLTKEERRDARKLYNPMTISELYEMTPSVDWKNYLEGIGYTKNKELV